MSIDGWDYLRCNVQTCEVETTQRVSFSLDEGKSLFNFIKKEIEKGSYTEGEETFLGRYPILEINPAYIRIGCHKVALKEVERFAKQQGWN